MVRFYPVSKEANVPLITSPQWQDIAEALDVHYAYFFFGTGMCLPCFPALTCSPVCLLGALFVLLVVPETKGRTDEDMKAYFMGHKDKEDKPV